MAENQIDEVARQRSAKIEENFKLSTGGTPIIDSENGNNLIAHLELSLQRGLKVRQDANQIHQMILAVKYLCRKQPAEFSIKKSGSISCGYCFENFTDDQIDASLNNPQPQVYQQYSPETLATVGKQVFGLSCGHSLHCACLQELTSDFMGHFNNRNFNQVSVECPMCPDYQGALQQDAFLRVNVEQIRNEQI